MYTSNSFDCLALGRHGLRRNKIFQSILFPVNFSSASKAIAPYVRDLAKLTGGTVTLLHVVPRRSAWYGAADLYFGTDSLETLRELRKVHLPALAKFRDEYFEGVPCQTRIQCGSVAGQIIEFAEQSGADLIMMGIPGVGKGDGSLMDSIVAEVLRDAPCAVWTNPHAGSLKPFTGFHSIVCALSPNRIRGEYVKETAALGSVFGSRLTFVSAIPPGSMDGEDSRVLTLEEQYPEARQDQLAGTGPVYVEAGPVGGVVRHVAEVQSADLVVINRGHKPDPIAGFETHAWEIVLESPCPVLSLPTKAASASVHIVHERHTREVYAVAGAY
ncbi:MAG: universal stress protein [Bryobacteraceae bacterium]